MLKIKISEEPAKMGCIYDLLSHQYSHLYKLQSELRRPLIFDMDFTFGKGLQYYDGFNLARGCHGRD